MKYLPEFNFYKKSLNNLIKFGIFLTGDDCLDNLPYEILEHIFQYLTLQDCIISLSPVCRRFRKIVHDSGKLWKSLETEAEFNVDSFMLVVGNHAKHFHSIALRFSQKMVRYNSPKLHLENTLALCINLRHLDLAYNTSITNIHFIREMKYLESLILNSCTSIDTQSTIYALKYSACRLKTLDISNCSQFDEVDIVHLIENLKILEVFNIENTVLLSVENAKAILGSNDLKEFAFSPNWGPPPVWGTFMEENKGVKYGECFHAHLQRISLPNYIHSDEEDYF